MRKKIVAIGLFVSIAITATACQGNKSYDISTKGDNVYITIPKEQNPSDDLSLSFINAGFTEAQVNNDGSVKYTIGSDDYKKYLQDLMASINSYIEEINSGAYDSINNISLDDDQTTFTVNINSKNFTSNEDDLVITALASKLLQYQAFADKKELVKIKYIDADTKEAIDTRTIKNQ